MNIIYILNTTKLQEEEVFNEYFKNISEDRKKN